MKDFRSFILGAVTVFIAAAIVVGGLSCGVTQKQVHTGIDQAAHVCVTIATMACRPDVAQLCLTAHDINELISPLLTDIAAGKVQCAVDAGKE